MSDPQLPADQPSPGSDPVLEPVLPPPPASPWARDAVSAEFATQANTADATDVDPGAAASPWSRMEAEPGSANGEPAEEPVTPVPPATLERPRRSKLLVGGAVVAVLAVGAAGVFAVTRFTSGAKGGAATPEELGTILITAIENEDVFGALDTLLPGEREAFRQPTIDFFNELTRLEVLAPDADLARIGGFDFEVTNEVISTQSTNVADIVNIDVTGDITASVDGSLVPIGDLITDNVEAAELDEMRSTKETTTEPLEFSLTAVEQGGRWYFSAFHTAAEAIRDELEIVEPIPLEGVALAGAETPEAAFEQVVASIEALDLRGVIAGLNPNEAVALQRYAPMFLDDVETARDEMLAEIEFSLSITRNEFRVEGEGDARTVFIDAFAVEGSADGMTFSYEVEGDCVRMEFEDMVESFEQCYTSEALDESMDEFLADTPEIKELVLAVQEALADMAPTGLELRQVDGLWYVSPLATGSEALLKFMRALDREEIDHIIELAKGIDDESFFDLAMGGLYSDEFIDEEYVVDEDVDFEVTTEATGGHSAAEQCWDIVDAAEAASCFDGSVASGELDQVMVPVVLRFPECGYSEAGWEGIYEMDDATFVATVDASRQCFLDKVASGEVDIFELPEEIAFFECFEGRNWYTTFDDPAYDERYYACIDAAYAAAG